MSTTEHSAPVASETTLVHLDPASLVIETNVRAGARLDEGFVASIAERGVLVPVVAHRRSDGSVAVIYGQRRTLAAAQVARTSIPVYLVASPGEADRLVDQMSENGHRAALSTGEKVAVFAQLDALGMSAGEMAKRTATKREHVAAALTTAASQIAVEAVAAHQAMTLDQGAVLADFADESEVVEALLGALARGTFDHVAQQARNARALREQGEKITADLKAAGVKVIEGPRGQEGAVALASLSEAGGERLSAQTHARCPGHAAYVRETYGYTYPQAQQRQDEDEREEDLDALGEEDEDDQGDQGDQGESPARPQAVWSATMGAVYVCCEPTKYGHRTSAGQYPGARVAAADKSEAERQADAAARRDVIDSNKAWESATTVRREWLRSFATRKSAPREAAQFIATTITSAGYAISRAVEGRHALARDLLGAPLVPGRVSPALTTEKTTSPRATVITLVLLLAAYEDSTNRNAWRSPDEATTRYLRFLASQGYTLAPVEHRACGEQPTPEVDRAEQNQEEQDQPTT